MRWWPYNAIKHYRAVSLVIDRGWSGSNILEPLLGKDPLGTWRKYDSQELKNARLGNTIEQSDFAIYARYAILPIKDTVSL